MREPDVTMPPVLDPQQIAPESPRPITRAEYERLAALGFFEDERVELLYGVIVTMTPPDPMHAWVIERLTMLLVPKLVGRAVVRIQSSYAASDDSMPEPDVAIVPEGDHRKAHPSEALLMIEVSYSSLRKDRNVKARLYAECGVPEYWIIDVEARRIEVFTEAKNGVYTHVITRSTGDEIAPTAFPDVNVRVDDLF